MVNSESLQELFLDLTTAHVADACMRVGAAVRHAPDELTALWEGVHIVGWVRPVRHHGSVDVFLEAVDDAAAGEVLVVDNDGRRDEACIGDLVALEVRGAGLAGIVVWGLHRDTVALRTIRLPVFSCGALPVGPRPSPTRRPAPAVGARPGVACGEHRVGAEDVVLADDDGVLFLPGDRVEDIARTATSIRDTERRQAARAAAGTSLRTQTDFPAYLRARRHDPHLTFRDHLRSRGAEIEE